MALTDCPECGREVSDKAVNCPHCGYGMPLAQEALVSTSELTQKANVPERTKLGEYKKDKGGYFNITIGLLLIGFVIVLIVNGGSPWIVFLIVFGILFIKSGSNLLNGSQTVPCPHCGKNDILTSTHTYINCRYCGIGLFVRNGYLESDLQCKEKR